jgi:hypothetical protein
MATKGTSLVVSRTLIYLAMIVVLLAVCAGAARGAAPIFLAVGFIGEIVLVSTAHLSSVIQANGLRGPSRSGGA